MFPNDLRHFKRSEFPDPDNMHVPFLRWLDRVRERSGVTMTITSSYRAGDAGLHGRGMAVDVRSKHWSVSQKWRLAAAVFALADDAPGKVEFEPVPGDCGDHQPHWHIGVDPRAAAQHEFVESSDV